MASFTEAFSTESPTIVHRLREWAHRAGDRPCLHYGENERSFSYREFNQLTDNLASHLADTGVGPGDRLVVLSDNALLSALAMFAAWKRRAVYCPVNTQLPPDMLAFVLQDLDAATVLGDETVLTRLGEVSARSPAPSRIFVCRDPRVARPTDAPAECSPDAVVTYLDDISDPQVAAEREHCAPGDVASIIYTSGTTSRPKGVIQRHAWLHALCATQSVWTHADDVIHCDLPMHHIGGAFSLFARSIWSGASAALWDRFSGSQFWGRIDRYSASTSLLIDVMADWLLASPRVPDESRNSLNKVHLQPLGARHREFAQRFGIDFILTGYGSSELGNALIGCIDECVDGGGTQQSLWRGYSRAEIGARLHALYGPDALYDGSGELSAGLMGVPSGVYDVALEEQHTIEEAHTGRMRFTPRLDNVLFAGYLNRPDAQNDVRGGDSYLAPDIARVDRSGCYYFLGREQGFLRVKGENVSAAAVESVFLTHPQVSQCVALGLPAAQGGEDDIVIVVQPAPDAVLEAAALLDWGRGKLPHFMQPSACNVMAELPLTSTMKIDRGALQAQFSSDD